MSITPTTQTSESRKLEESIPIAPVERPAS